MAGAFTHISVCDKICGDAKKIDSKIGDELGMLINRHSQFVYLGAVSPDLPYLSFELSNVNWADVFHYENTNETAIKGFAEIKQNWPGGDSNEIKLAWLLGYISHLVIDATIHPIVQAVVGDYAHHKDEHRICEMTQDTLVFKKIKNNEIQYADFLQILDFCRESPHYKSFISFWENIIKNSYPGKSDTPDPGDWVKNYTTAVSVASKAGRSSLAGLFRHIGSVSDYFYKSSDEIINQYPNDYNKYYGSVKLPFPVGTNGNFLEKGVTYAADNVTDAWNRIYSGLQPGSTFKISSIIKNWNLDTGVDLGTTNGEVTYWK